MKSYLLALQVLGSIIVGAIAGDTLPEILDHVVAAEVNQNLEGFDALVVVGKSVEKLTEKVPESVISLLKKYREIDSASNVFVIDASTVPYKRIIFSATGDLDKDYDDVRSVAEAAEEGITKAVELKAVMPLLLIDHIEDFSQSQVVGILGALKALYVPIEVRESVEEKSSKARKLGIVADSKVIKYAHALETGRVVSRDIGGSDPERMAAPKVEEYIKSVFSDDPVKIEVMQGQSTFEKEYPLLAAVNRCASKIPRHDGRVIWMTYEPEGPINNTIMLVGKGITFDTGGANVKTGTKMLGMSRDKVGAADVAGILKVASILKPKNTKIVAALAMVRNSIGADAYLPDEIITSRAGTRIRVLNTDAEGRMVMADVLAHMKEKASNEVNPHLMTIASLTGHAAYAVAPYTAIIDNGPAKLELSSEAIQENGENFGDPFEISNLRREDFDAVEDTSKAFVDVIQTTSASSSTKTNRGHQYPMAFLMRASKLDEHMIKSDNPLKYTHLDVAGSSGKLPEPTTASTVVALSSYFMPIDLIL